MRRCLMSSSSISTSAWPHMMCTGAQWTDFVIYNPFQSNPIHIVRILPDEAVFAEMEKRIRVADDIVKELIEAE